ncbi:hypothetical protein HWV62_7130 [Athelia sp. TMB]|nr:hypothetical protein HWV62_40555 [Athelia sp. TMB]KAF7976256.1 hypothetical protein HWV62_7130 [Athelia sp. TMB]
MGWFDNSNADQYNSDVDNLQQHQPSKVHELIGGAAAYEAAKAYEDHCAANGQPPSHAKAKEVLAGLAGAFVDREVETRGLDFVDREEAKRQARQQIDQYSPQDLGY